MKKWTLGIALALWTFPAMAETAAQMASYCRPFDNMRILNTTDGGQSVLFIQTFETGVCWGAFATFQRLSIYRHPSGEPYLGICSPPESTRGQIIKVFLRYVDSNPEIEHKEFENVAWTALVEAFPCTQK